MQTETPQKDELRFYALAPGPDGLPRFQLPTTFQLEDPDAYYKQVIEPRIARTYERVLWSGVWGKAESQKSGGGDEPPQDPPPPTGGEDPEARGGLNP